MSFLKYQNIRDSDELDKYSNIKKKLIRKSQALSNDSYDYSFYFCIEKSCKNFYENNSNQSYWLIIESWIKETKAKKDYKNFVQCYFNDPKIRRSKIPTLLANLNGQEVDNKSFVNFIRHFPVLDQYILDQNFHISVLNNFIRLHIWHKKTNLVLHFKSDFLIDFYSYDKDENDHNDHLVYSMKGSFSSSSSLRKSYKIERLLALFDREHERYNNHMWLNYNGYIISENEDDKTYKNIVSNNFKGKLVG